MRTGWTEQFFALSEEEQKRLPQAEKRESCGVAQGEDVLRWHWENGIAAVATDT